MTGVILTNPKYSHNVAGVLRACSCFGIEKLVWTGKRVVIDKENGERLPREERMKGYKDVEWKHSERPFDEFKFCIPVGIELHPSAQTMTLFEHPKDAVYVFGPEDGGIPQVMRRFCHTFVFIPSYHCLNLSAAVNVTLADRMMKQQLSGQIPYLGIGDLLHEKRGFETPVLDSMGWDGK